MEKERNRKKERKKEREKDTNSNKVIKTKIKIMGQMKTLS